MSRRLVLSAFGGARIDAVLGWLPGRSGEVLLVAPSRGAAADLLRRSAVRQGSSFGVHRATLIQVAHRLAAPRLGRAGLAPLSRLGVEALATRCIQMVRDERELQYFEPVARMPGFPRALSRTLTEIRLQGLSGSELVAGSSEARSRDLARILDCYEGELDSYGLTDLAGVLSESLKTATTGDHALVGLDLALLDVWPDSLLERKLLSALVNRAGSVMATLPSDEPGAREALLEALGPEVEMSSRDDETQSSSIARARRFLFAVDVPDPVDVPEGGVRDETLDFFSAPGEDRECVEIARRIHRLADQGVGFDQMAILVRSVESYFPLVEDALRRAGVPAFFSRGTTRPDPAGRAFLALLACASEGLSASRFAEYLSLGEVAEIDDSGAPPAREVPWVEPEGEQLVFKTLEAASLRISSATAVETSESPRVPAHWERLLVDASVVGGWKRWKPRLEGLQAELRLRLRSLDDDEEPRREHLHGELRRLETLQRFALPVIDTLHSLPVQALWGEWLTALEELAARVLRNPATVLRLLSELRPMENVGPVSLEQVRDVLTERLAFLQAEPPERRYGRVFVGTIPEALGRTFHCVFVPGLAEGIFPRRALEDPLLLDQDRRLLGADLELREDRFLRERSLLRWALGCASSKLVASFPRVDPMQGRARVPSFYALDLLRAAEGRLPRLEALEASATETQLSWPAPNDPAEAIDSAEFDLAVLAPLLRPDAGNVRARGRFLLAANPRLERSLRSRWYRWEPRWRDVDGLVGPGVEALEILRSQLPSERSYSPTALQTFAACPYRFLLYAIHRIGPREELTSIEQLDPRTRGSLFHEVQFKLLIQARERGLLPVHSDFEIELMALVDACLSEVAETYRDKLSPAIPRIWTSEIEALRMDLRGWIRKLLDDNEDWTPVAFEYGFGLAPRADRDPASTEEEAVVLDRIRLRGSIDVVERDWKRRAIRVTDHKTGRPPARKDLVIGGGEILQPVLYALAAETNLAGEEETVVGGRLFYATQRGGFESLMVPLDERSRESAARVFELVEESLSSGFLPAAPRADACRFCDYRSVCGPYEELRVSFKDKEPLAALEALRQLP